MNSAILIRRLYDLATFSISMRRLERNAGSFVFDSEPEREEARKTERVNRRRARKQAVRPSDASHSANSLPASDLESPVSPLYYSDFNSDTQSSHT
jgi:hypothetical protein